MATEHNIDTQLPAEAEDAVQDAEALLGELEGIIMGLEDAGADAEADVAAAAQEASGAFDGELAAALTDGENAA